MCGIVGMVGDRDVTPVLMEGLRRLEYRGYDSAGLAVIDGGKLRRLRRLGKVQALRDALDGAPLSGASGIAHTRWATHGKPSEINAHPHTSGGIAVAHNGIIENHEALRVGNSRPTGTGSSPKPIPRSSFIASTITWHEPATCALRSAAR